ncbi:MAG: hypothetical protein GXP49_05815 [Deltaproteobacteria bacterium]|nr:hypothetical protein [Deltaproteobacteria bacterium]
MKTGDCKFEVKKRTPSRLRPVEERIKDFEPADLGFDEEAAIAEANRCQSTVTCEACDVCILICPDMCISRNSKTGKIEIDLDYCKGCGLCAKFCPRSAITMVEQV